MESLPEIPAVDLFAGAGGFAVAARLAGCQTRLSVEIDATCCETLRLNHRESTHSIEQADVQALSGTDLRKLAKIGRCDPLIILGGPPCQPFSKASYWTDPGNDSRYRRARDRGEDVTRPSPITTAKADPRRNLLHDFLRLVVEAHADAFVMENVRSLLHPRNRKTFEALLSGFAIAGYRFIVADTDATEYGVPQKRRRLFVIGSRHAQPVVPPNLADGRTTITEQVSADLAVEPFLEPYAGAEHFEEGEVVSGRWTEQLEQIPPGWNYKYLTTWAGHQDPVFEAETRFWNFLLKLAPDKPSWTINANPGPWVGPFHWTNRRLRTPELAAIQTFPHGYQFTGTRRQRVRQIGNAVPPLLAKAMIAAAMQSLDDSR